MTGAREHLRVAIRAATLSSGYCEWRLTCCVFVVWEPAADGCRPSSGTRADSSVNGFRPNGSFPTVSSTGASFHPSLRGPDPRQGHPGPGPSRTGLAQTEALRTQASTPQDPAHAATLQKYIEANTHQDPVLGDISSGSSQADTLLDHAQAGTSLDPFQAGISQNPAQAGFSQHLS